MLIAEKTVKFHSSLTRADLFTVESAIQREDHREEDSRLADNTGSKQIFLSFLRF